MKVKILIIILSVITFDIYSQIQVKETSTFQELIELFPELKIPSKRKDGKIRDINKISKEASIKYLHFTEDDLKMNDFSYNQDEDIKLDNWVEVLPGALGKITSKEYVALAYALLKMPTYGLETYKTLLTTFTYEGKTIDSMVIRSQYTRENDWRDVVFLENNILRIFDYEPNLENYDVKDGIYYITDEKQPMSIVKIADYQIDSEGEIVFIETHPKQYLKEDVDFYRSYRPDSDDPMNEYE